MGLSHNLRLGVAPQRNHVQSRVITNLSSSSLHSYRQELLTTVSERASERWLNFRHPILSCRTPSLSYTRDFSSQLYREGLPLYCNQDTSRVFQNRPGERRRYSTTGSLSSHRAIESFGQQAHRKLDRLDASVSSHGRLRPCRSLARSIDRVGPATRRRFRSGDRGVDRARHHATGTRRSTRHSRGRARVEGPSTWSIAGVKSRYLAAPSRHLLFGGRPRSRTLANAPARDQVRFLSLSLSLHQAPDSRSPVAHPGPR